MSNNLCPKCKVWYEKSGFFGDGPMRCPSCGGYQNPKDDPLYKQQPRPVRKTAAGVTMVGWPEPPATPPPPPPPPARKPVAQVQRQFSFAKPKPELTGDQAFVKKLTEQILADYDITLKRVEFRRRKGSFHQMQDDGSSLLVYGNGSMERARSMGFFEYKKIARWLGYTQYSDNGLKGIWRLVCHEVAHAVQWQRNGRHRGSVHNECFFECYKELMILYPYEEAKELAA